MFLRNEEKDLIMVVGRATKDVTTREVETKDGKATTVEFGPSIAVDYWNAKAEKEDTMFLNIEAWDNVARNLSKVIKKGMEVAMLGKLIKEKYTDKEGKERTSFKIRVYQFKVANSEYFKYHGEKEGSVEEDFSGIEGFHPTEDDEIPF